MRAEHARHFLHRRDARPQGRGSPVIEKPTGPVRRDVGPEELELLLEEVGPDGLEVVP